MSLLAFFFVHPWGVEPQSSEPESDILSIELWVLFSKCVGKSNKDLLVLQNNMIE